MSVLPVLAALAVVAVCVVAIRRVRARPDLFAVTRSQVVTAAPETIFPYLNDLHRFQDWSPWARMDPDARVSFDGPAAGVGAALAWEGRMTGAGRMTITESRPHAHVSMRLDFLKPFKAVNTTLFRLEPLDGTDAGRTRVVWTMSGRNDLRAKLISLVMDCEKIVGAQFEAGLDNLRQCVETAA